MNVRVLLFAAHRETAGIGRTSLDLPDGSSVEDAFASLSEQYPGMAQLRPFTTFAVNREVVPAGHTLSTGDELALLQPVSGGQND
jgi:molybdopterin synthase catalytic subunit